MSYHHDIKLAGTVTVGPKGQVVIPSDTREDMGIRPGDKLIALYNCDKKSVIFITEEQAQNHIARMGEEFARIKQTLEGN